METTERIVEAYVRYVKNWATIPNIRCKGQLEIDLFAIDPRTFRRYHIETSISISTGFSKLTGKPFSREDAKKRVKAAGQRRTIGFFIERKFEDENVLDALAEYGCRAGHCNRVIATWDWTDEAGEQAKEANIELWRFSDLIHEIAEHTQDQTSYFGDDTLRTLHLAALAEKRRA